LEFVVGIMPIGTLAVHRLLNALDVQALGTTAQSFTDIRANIDCHIGTSDFSLGELFKTVTKC